MKRSAKRPPSGSLLNRSRRLLIPLTIILLLSMACAVPSLPQINFNPSGPVPTATTTQARVEQTGQNAVTPNAAPNAAGQNTAVPGGAAPGVQPTAAPTLPPALVEVNPLPKSELAAGTAPVFYFNQPMQRASVEAAFKAQPDLGVRFEWLDDATLRLVPSKPFSSDSGWKVTIATGAKAANGLALPEPVEIDYLAAGPLRLAERLPAPDAIDVNPSSAIVASFNYPVVALGADPQSLPPGFTIDPTVNGKGEWLNTSTYIFYPQPALMGGTRYTVRLNTSLKSVEGSALASDTPAEWSFNTAAPVLLNVQPGTEQPVPLDSAFTLTFNQPMDTASVEADFSLLGPDGAPVKGKFTWNETATEVKFQPTDLLKRGSGYTLALFGTARSQGGATIGKDFVAALVTVAQFAVTNTRPAAGETLSAYQGYGTITLAFSSPAAADQDFARLVSLNPPVTALEAYRDGTGYQIFVSGYFKPSTSYTLSIASELRDQWGAALGTPFSFTFTSQPARPELRIASMGAGGQVLFVPSNETSIPAQATNITRLNLRRGSLTLPEFIQASLKGITTLNWESKVAASWPVVLYPSPDTSEPLNIPLAQEGGLEPGLYFLNIETQPVLEDQPNPMPNLVVISPIQIVMKISARQAFVWAVRIAENTPAANFDISIYDSSASVLASCKTNDQGFCQTDLPNRDNYDDGLFAVLGQPGDSNFSISASYWNNGISSWDFGLPYENKGNKPEIYLYTDRPIYRPGQAVNLRVIARAQDNGRYTNLADKQVTVEVVSPYDQVTGQSQVITTLRLPLDAFGSASATYTLPDDARPGSYLLRIQEPGEGACFFEVAEYRKPEIDLQVKFTQPDTLTGQDLQAQVTARYFFGAPAGNLSLRWSLFRDPGYLNVNDGLQVGKVDTSWLMPWNMYSGVSLFVNEGQAQTNPDGTATISISGKDLKERLGQWVDQLQNLKIEVTAVDESGLPVSARGQARLHPSPYYIGLRPEQWSVPANQEITYTVRTVDWQGNPVADKPLTARFMKVVWVQEENTGPYILPKYRPEYTEMGSTDFRTSPQGEARLAFTPAEPGTFILEVTGEEGAVSQALTWVSGPGSAAWPELPNQHIRLQADAQTYQPGQSAKVFIPNPFTGGTLALVTVERGKVMRSQVMTINEASTQLELPVTIEDAPNVYVSVTLLGRTNGRPDIRVGYVELDVDPADLKLQVEAETSPQKPQPGGEVTINIRAKDAQGKPVQGEFSLALIDKAVLALADPNAPPISQAFYGKQPLGVQSGFSLANYAGRFVYSPPGRGGGGGEGQAAEPVRSKFADTAYWNAAIQTDVTGVAQVNLTLPDNLTTWRADVRGLTADTRVGQVETDLTVSKPLLIRPAAPRFVVSGDHLELAAVVHNNTAEALKASVRLEAAGFTLDDPNQAVQSVDIPANDRRQVSWWGVVQDVPALDLTYRAEAGSLRDAAHPELNPLPVLRYTAPQTFGTSGVLPGPGERQELVSLPRSFEPVGGELQVELSPSLSATVLDGLKNMDVFPHDFNEPVLSHLLPNLAAAQLLKDLKLENEKLRSNLQTAITDGVDRLVRVQNENGGWGWASGYASDTYISSYVMFGLTRAAQSGVFVSSQVLQKGQEFLATNLFSPEEKTEGWKLDRLAFQYFVLLQTGRTDMDFAPLYAFADKLSPWGKAFLALAIEGQSPGDQRARALISNLETSALRSATGANWQDPNPAWRNWSTATFTTAVVTYAIARVDPAAPVLTDAVRHLVSNRRPNGTWTSSYDTAWALLALIETMRGTGDAQPSFSYAANINGAPLINGKVENMAQALNPVSAVVPLANLNADAPNALVLKRDKGSGRLYYRAFLQVDRPAADAPAIERGMTITRQYYRSGQDCRQTTCTPLDTIDLADPQPVLVRLTLTLPEAMRYVVVEDRIPAGAEVLNPRLKTSQQNIVPADGQTTSEGSTPYDLEDPFGQGWGWWLFKDPQVYDDRIRWVVDELPAGTYELTYRLTPFLAGEFRVLPAHAWQYYFPEVEGASKGAVLTIK